MEYMKNVRKQKRMCTPKVENKGGGRGLEKDKKTKK